MKVFGALFLSIHLLCSTLSFASGPLCSSLFHFGNSDLENFYPTPIEGMQDSVALVLKRGIRILYAKRGSNTTGTGQWAYVGGKLERGESLLQSAQREAAEEIGVKLVDPKLLFVTQANDEKKTYRMFVVMADFEGDPVIQSQETDKLAGLLALNYNEEPYPLFGPTSAYFAKVNELLKTYFASKK